MIPQFRDYFNGVFTDTRYQSLLKYLNEFNGQPVPFRVAETPVFIPLPLKKKLVEAGNAIVQTFQDPEYLNAARKNIPSKYFIPGDDRQPLWLTLDFAICSNSDNDLFPMLIELQGFPSLYCYQHVLADAYKKYFNLNGHLSHLEKINNDEYIQYLKSNILGDHLPKHVILMDIEPEKQNTYIDFVATGKFLGIKNICITKVIVKGKQLYYENEGSLVEIKRIYNRVIFDELFGRSDLSMDFDFNENYNVEWAGHPNWFFLASKFTLPYLKSQYVPESILVSKITSLPDNLRDYILKPVYSFSGKGIIFDVTIEDINQIEDKEQWILQRKVSYTQVFENEGESVKAEVRLMYCWEPEMNQPKLLTNLVRLSKGKMTGVKYNKGMKWVGSSIGFWEV